MNCKDIAGSTPRLRGASCSQPSHQITTDTSLVLPKPQLQTLLCPLLALLFLTPLSFPYGVAQPRPGSCCERDQGMMQPGETKSLCDHHVPSWQWRGSRKHFPKELLPLSPYRWSHTDFITFQVLKESGRKRGGERKDL